MNYKELCHMVGLIEDDILIDSEYKTVKPYFNRKKSIYYVACFSAFICLMVIIVPIILIKTASSIQNGCSLPGALEINPAVMYDGDIYYWKCLAGPASKLPQGELPKGYKYVGDIEYNNKGKLTKDFQFIAKFKATGQLYYNIDDPNTVCICITTYWLDKTYVLFQKKI